MSHQKPYLALSISYLFALTLAFLFATQFFFPSANAEASQQAAPPLQSAESVALVKSIVVDGGEKLEVSISEVKVKRDGGEEEPGRANMVLYAGDEVTTGPNAQLTLLFLDNPQEKNNEVLVDANTTVRIGSLFTWVGRVLIRVKGAFDTKTEKVRLGVQGTEYELVVAADGTTTIKVLKGAVSVTTASPIAKNSGERVRAEDTPLFLHAAFFAQERLTQQNEIEFVVVSGQMTNIEREFAFTNNCQRKHLFQIKGPRNLDWFQMLGADQFSVDPRSSRTIKFAFHIDGTHAAVGSHENEIVTRCLDCNQEPNCDLGGLLLPITVKVIGNGPSPTTTPQTEPEIAPGPTSAVAKKLEQITVPPAGKLIKTETSAEQVQQTLNWSDGVILAGQPTYTEQSVVPRFRTSEERDRAFRQARRDSILSNDSSAGEILAAVYVDWGNGAKAEQELRESALTSADPDSLTTLAEAYRLMGRLDDAEAVLKRAVIRDPTRIITLNAIGNVYLNQAKAAQEKKNFALARDYLEQANIDYTQALQVSKKPGEQNHRQAARSVVSKTNAETVTQSNLGEVHLKLGEIARQQGDAPEALSQYRLAARTFQTAAGLDHTNQFAFTGLGDAYREAGEVFVSRNEKANAEQYFTMSRDHYAQVAKLHSDMAEAYVGLGRVSDDTGHHYDAIRHFEHAAQVRPEQPDPHYYLAVALAGVDPRRAAEEAGTYLKTERPIFKQGAKAYNSQRILQGQPISTTPTPVSTKTPTPIVTPTAPPTPPPTSVRPVKVPGVKDKTPADALKELRKRGLDGRIEEKADCKSSGKVLYTEPAKDQMVEVGTTVSVYISTAGPNAVKVPDLRHRPKTDAEDELRRLGLTVSYGRSYQTDAEQENNVVRQKPEPYKPMMPGCSVELIVAIPIPKVQVPDFIGRARQDALRDLPQYFGDLTRGELIEVDSDRPANTVVDQTPKPGALVPRGTSVNLYIARAAPTDTGSTGDYNRLLETVPDLRGLTQQQAKDAIANTNGRVRLGNITYKAAGYDYVVVEQTPLPGSRVAHGTPIDLVVSYLIK